VGRSDPNDELMTLLDDLLAVCLVGKVADSEVKASKKSVRK